MITPLYAALLAFVFLALSIQVIRSRYRTLTALGDANDALLRRQIRAHGNFAEYVPLILLMMLMLELQNASSLVLHVIGAMLLIGRISHGFGVSREPEILRFRQFGMVLTFAALISAALRNLMLAL